MIRVLLMAVLFGRVRRQHPEMFDSEKALASVRACLAEAQDDRRAA